MKKKTKVLLIVAASLMAVGLILFAGVMTAMKWDFRKIGTVNYTTNEYVLQDDFTDIAIDTNTADIHFVKSEDGVCRVVCYEDEKRIHAVKVENGVLSVLGDKSFDFSFSFDQAKITVYLPKTSYEHLLIKSETGNITVPSGFTFGGASFKVTTGDIRMKDAVCDSLTVSLTTGDLDLKRIQCESLTVSGTTSDMEIEDLVASGSIKIKLTTGDLELERCDAATVEITSSTGDIEASFLSGKTFDVKSSTGEKRYPKDSQGGPCKIRTSTGDIEVKIIR